MNKETFVRLTRIEAAAEEVYAWHVRPGAMERLIPPWVRATVVNPSANIQNGARATLRIRKGPFRWRWEVERVDCETRGFTDVQVHGPFAEWIHRHAFEQDNAACYLEDRVQYRLPFGSIGRFLADSYMRRELERLFVYRHRILAQDMAVHRAYSGLRRRRILLSGASGFIGSALKNFLTAGGHVVVSLTRTPNNQNDIGWDPESGCIEPRALENFDFVIHLAGESISSRWTAAKKERIRSSRVSGTRLLAETLSKLEHPPTAFLSASAIGWYGHRGGEILDEDSMGGTGFLADVCRQWEAAVAPAEQKGIRTVILRTGVVLSPAGGVLRSMLPAFTAGVGGPVGSGYQFISWIAMDDVLEAIYHAMLTPALRGPVNLVSPHPIANRDFAKMLGFVMGRPSVFAMPAIVARAFLGKMADGLLLSSTRVRPHRLIESGFLFQYPELESGLRHLLGRM